jgi:succinyl-diaminopimelate desuccinylase
MKENYQPITMKETDYKALVKPYYEKAYQALCEDVAINSVYDETTRSETAPFGAGVEKALSWVAKLGKSLGFEVDRCDNYVTELTYGKGEKTLDIYAHSDVVPVMAKNWTKDPFHLTLEDGVMYGRGTCDDKGPGLACLFAVKALMDYHRLGGYRLRFLFGGNEENDSLCLKHYFEVLKKGYPTLGISPDADYPLIYAEKSIYAYEASYPVTLPGVKPFKLGNALNIVLGEVSVSLAGDEKAIQSALKDYLAKNPGLQGSYKNGILWFKGTAAHGSMPWLGNNAGLHLLAFLGQLLKLPVLKDIFVAYQGGKGESFQGNYKDTYFTETSYNVGRIQYDGKTLTLAVNLRIPSSLDVQPVLDNVAKKTHARVHFLGGSAGFVADPNSAFVQLLMKAYQDETGDTASKPLAIGGGTYARESRHSVAFGAAFPGRDYRMHGDDEYFPLSDFEDNLQIYAHAIDSLSTYLRSGKKA